jgi:hypothetical protein
MRLDRRNCSSTDPVVMSTAELYVNTTEFVLSTAAMVETRAECALRPIPAVCSPSRR